MMMRMMMMMVMMMRMVRMMVATVMEELEYNANSSKILVDVSMCQSDLEGDY